MTDNQSRLRKAFLVSAVIHFSSSNSIITINHYSISTLENFRLHHSFNNQLLLSMQDYFNQSQQMTSSQHTGIHYTSLKVGLLFAYYHANRKHVIMKSSGPASFAQERIFLDEQVRFSSQIAIYNELNMFFDLSKAHYQSIDC